MRPPGSTPVSCIRTPGASLFRSTWWVYLLWWWWLMAMEEWWDYLSSLCLALSWAFALITSFWLHRKGKYCFIPVFVCEQMGAQKRGQSCPPPSTNTKKLLKAEATSQLPAGKVNAHRVLGWSLGFPYLVTEFTILIFMTCSLASELGCGGEKSWSHWGKPLKWKRQKITQ